MFAVAIWDAPRQRLVLARDRVGKKPLYYFGAAATLLFGSETKAILAALGEAPPSRCAGAARLLHVRLRRRAATRSSRACGGSSRARALIVDARDRHADATSAIWSWPAGADRDVAPGSRGDRGAPRRARRSGAHPPSLGRAARRVSQRRHGLGGGARADDAPLVASGQDVHDRLRRSRRTTSWTRRGAPRARFGADHHEQIVTPDGVARRRDAGAFTTTSRSPTRRRFRRTTSRSSRGST